MMYFDNSLVRGIAILCSCMLISGCGPDGPEIAVVEGTVTLDGKPLPRASVVFVNQSGRPAAAMTDDKGAYKLNFDETRKGAIPGENVVRISTFQGGGGGLPSAKETVAAEYNTQTKLRFNVELGRKNVANIDLMSGGAVAKPAGSD